MWALVISGLIAVELLLEWRRSRQPALDFFCLALTRGITRVYYNIWIRRRAPFPPLGACILVANHTCSADPAFLQARARRPLSFMIAEEYFNIPGASWLFRYMQCIPVSRTGRDVKSVRIALRRLQAGRILCLFPEGSLSG